MPASIETLLKATIGLEAASIGSATVARAVRSRQQATGLPEDAYRVRLLDDPAELQGLVEAVVVSETWFFRDRGAFDALAQLAGSVGRTPLRILSLPCATGEEPYTIAMALLESGLPFSIDAMDVSQRAITAAQRAVYGANAFRGRDLAFRDRYFATVPGGFQLFEAIRKQVRFAQGNLFATEGSYDVVFCRNLLIYFDRATQESAMAVLKGLLRPGGLLFLGPAETVLASRSDFAPSGMPMAFAFRRVEASAPALPVPLRTLRPRPRPEPLPLAPPRRPVSAPAAAEDSLRRAQRLANEGHLLEAARLCEERLRREGPSADAYALLGLVREAASEHAEATTLYRKALYLDPRHADALTHLALLLEHGGDTAGAHRLRDRLSRNGGGT